MINLGTSKIGHINIGETAVKSVKSGDRIVFGYDAEIEYLQSSGTQWIELGRKLNSSIDIIDIDFTLISQVSSTSGLFGARTASDNKNFSVIVAINNNIVLDMNNGDLSRYRLNSGTTGYNKRCTVFMLNNLREIYFNGIKAAYTNISAQSFITDHNAELFRISDLQNNIPSIRLHSFKWRQFGTGWIYDMIPVRVGQKGYMYDKISGELFGNAGTGDFILGPDVV